MYVRRRAAEIIFDYGRVYGRYIQIDVLFLSRCVTVSSFFLVFFSACCSWHWFISLVVSDADLLLSCLFCGNLRGHHYLNNSQRLLSTVERLFGHANKKYDVIIFCMAGWAKCWTMLWGAVNRRRRRHSNGSLQKYANTSRLRLWPLGTYFFFASLISKRWTGHGNKRGLWRKQTWLLRTNLLPSHCW